MRFFKLNLRNVSLLALPLALAPVLHAQDDGCGNECKANTNIAIVLNAPVSSSAQVMGTGWGIVGGAGYNFSKQHALVSEFMWNRVYPSRNALQPLQTALQSKDLRANTDFYALTANYRFELRGRTLGAYLIGGGGWYFRNTWLSKEVPSGTGNACIPVWRWFGYRCTSGIVNPNQPPVVSSLNSLGANGGVGVTARVGAAPYRVYAEARYHFIPTSNISTHFIAISLGVRY